MFFCKMNMKYLFSLSFLLWITVPAAFATGGGVPVSGVIRSSSGKPVEMAVVYVGKLSLAVTTDERGMYRLNLPVGEYELAYSHLNYESAVRQVVVKRGTNIIPDVVLTENPVMLSDVIITGSRAGATERKGFAVNVIETQAIALQSVQVNEILDRTAGVRIRQDGGMGSRVNYNINGLSGNSIKIFIDGVPASNYGPSFSLSSIPPALIERIEVYKGVVPGYLSEDALGGAINIILKQRRRESLTASYSAGSFNSHQWNMTGSYRWNGGFTVDASAFYNYSDNSYRVWGKDISFIDTDTWQKIDSDGKKVNRFHDAYRSFGGKFNIGFTDVAWADQFLLGAVLSQARNEIQNGATMQVVYGDRHSRRKSDVFTLDYSKRDFLLKGLSLKIDASYSFLHRQTIDTVGIQYDWHGPIMKDGNYLYYHYAGEVGAEAGGRKTAAIDRDYAAMVRGSLSYRIGENHGFFVNYMFNDFRRKVSDEYQPAALQALANTRDLQKNITAFTYENIAFSGRLRTNLFYKHYFQTVISNEPKLQNNEYILDRFRKNVSHNGYGATFSFALTPDLFLLASAEKALRLPSANELFGNGSDNSLAALALKPESSLNANLGFNYTLKVNQLHSFDLSSSVYLRDTRDMIRATLNGQYSFTYAENLESVFTRGFDAELAYDYAGKMNFRFNVSKFDVLFNTKYNQKGDPYNFYRMQIRNEPSFKFNGQAAFFFDNLLQRNAKTSVYGSISYVNGFFRNWANVGSKNRDYIPEQYPVDLGVTHTFRGNKWVLSLDAKNVLNQQIFDNFGLQKPGRALYAKITYFIF
jgi:outer membrane receptor protein involved in Fe transport